MRDAATHVIVSTIILAIAIAAARWIGPLTARTRHAILAAGMASLFLPSSLITRMIERTGTAVVTPIRNVIAPLPMTIVPPNEPASFPWTTAIVIVWAVIGLALLFRSLVITRRLLAGALRAGTPPPQRTIDALRAARERVGVRTSIDLIASPLCEAPAVVRVLRPIIVLPADGCQSLDDEELESLLCHECAHVARRDNLFGLVEAIAGAVFWFNPLVWIARRRLAAAREEACDERVTDAAMPAETYVGALAKICRSLIAPRVAAVSCMASAHLKERIEHLMRYDTLRTSALSHRLTSSAATIAVLLTVIAAGIVTASPASSSDPFALNYSVIRSAPNSLTFHTKIVDSKSKATIGEPNITVQPGHRASVETTNGNSRWVVEVDTDDTGAGTITLSAWVDGALMQTSSHTFASPNSTVPNDRRRNYTGEPISLSLQNADIRDVLRVFGQLTGMEMVIAPEVTGTVSVNFKDVPWDEALDRMLAENGYTWKVEENKMTIAKR